MKERIEQLAAGEVLVKKPELDFSPAYLEGRVEAGTVQNKELVIRVRNRVPFKGFFYSTNERVKIETKQAAGQSAAVLFEINTIDLKAGDEITGAVVVVGNAGSVRPKGDAAYTCRIWRLLSGKSVTGTSPICIRQI